MNLVLSSVICLLGLILIILGLRRRRGKSKEVPKWRLKCRKARILRPGLVIIESLLDAEEQARAAELCFRTGLSTSQRFLDDQGRLTGHRQRRGRIYDHVKEYDAALAELCAEIVSIAKHADPSCVDLGSRHTHLLLLYYCDLAKGLGWHRDDGRIDGKSLEPVVSLSLGCACDFEYKMNPRDPPGLVHLNSGDAILFGGPARHIMHAVTRLYPDSAPSAVIQRHALYTDPLHPSLPPPHAFRLNLTWRHAPELSGIEKTDRFFHFGSATREYLDDVRTVGLDEARRRAQDRKNLRQASRRDKKRRSLLQQEAKASEIKSTYEQES